MAHRAFGAMLLLFAVSACTPLVAGGVLVGLVGVGMLTSRCYDYLDVAVFDADGRKTCAATVTASNGKDHFELGSCYYAALTDGHWKLRASLPGFTDALSTVKVEHAHDCTRNVQTVELTLNRASTLPGPKPEPPPPPVVALPSSATSPAPALPPTSSAPAAAPAATASAAFPNAPPDSSAAPPSGTPPDHLETSH